MASLTLSIGITPSFSPFFFIEKSEKASRTSSSSRAVMLCSFASLDCRCLGGAEGSASLRRRLGGCEIC
jgi:hypothetical protein